MFGETSFSGLFETFGLSEGWFRWSHPRCDPMNHDIFTRELSKDIVLKRRDEAIG